MSRSETESKIVQVSDAGERLTPHQNPLFKLPAELRALSQWCITPGTATDKIPRTLTGNYASTIDPCTWTDFHSACSAADERGWRVGFVFSSQDPYACIDLDIVNERVQAEKGQDVDPSEWTTAEEIERFESIVSSMDSYAERSRSGFGLHIIMKGKIGKGRRRDGVEIYSQERFLICTGNVHLDRPLLDRQGMLNNMLAQMPEATKTDTALSGEPYPNWPLADRASRDKGALGWLFAGNWRDQYPSQSEADLALVKLLLPHVESPLECWETFKLSGLGKRTKAKRTGYAQSTMALAIQHAETDAALVSHGRALAGAIALTHEQAQQQGMFWSKSPDTSGHFALLSDDDLRRQTTLKWLVKGVIPDSGIGTVFGQSQTYKSFLTLDLLAHIANGHHWFGRKVKAAPAVYVPFEGRGGIPNRVEAWRRAQAPQNGIPTTNMRFITEPLNLRQQADRDKLVATLTENGWAGGVLCIDTLAQAGIGIDENTSQGMGEMIAIFQELQRRLGGVVLIVHHSGKSERAGMRGHSSLHGALDFAIRCWRDDEWPKLDAQIVLDKVKDGESDLYFDFSMLRVVLGQDEDGDEISSLAVVPPTLREIENRPDDAQLAAGDDLFVDGWLRKEVSAGRYPTGRSLEAQRPMMKDERVLTQKRLRDAIDRLKTEGHLVEEASGPAGHKWLRAIDIPRTVTQA